MAEEHHPSKRPTDGFSVILFADGSGTIQYPNERIAATISKSNGGQQVLVMANDRLSTVLASFDYDGVGSANWKTGLPRLVVTKKGWTESNEAGDFIEQGEWPRQTKRTVRFSLNKYFELSFENRQNITITYKADGETVEFHCGEQTRRPAEESYVHSKVGSEGGKMILNVESKRHQGALRHAHTKPELRKYSPFGPHNSQTRMGGTFGLRQLLPSIFSEPDQTNARQTIIDDHCIMQQRLKLLNTLPVPMYGTAAPGLSSSFASSASQRMFHSQPLVATSYDQLCPVQFTAAQRRMLKSLYKHDANSKSNYKSKRRKIRMVRMKDLDRIVEGMEKGKLLVLCCMADWNPLCRKVISVLEAINSELVAARKGAAQQNFSSTHANNASDSTAHLKAPVQLVACDMSESSFLTDRYGFRCAPMFLCYFDQQLVHASNTMRTRNEFCDQAASAIDSGQKGVFLPKGFRFRGATNSLHAILDRAM